MSSRAEPLPSASFVTPALMRVQVAEDARAATRSGSGLPIELRGGSKALGPREVLTGLDLTVEGGEFVVVLGRSGGGKSTLLRLVAGLDRPSAGVVAIDGQ